MYLKTDFLEQCHLHLSPTIALSHGDNQERVLSLSPYAIPLEHGLCVLELPDGSRQLNGFSMSRLDVGLPHEVLEYTVRRVSLETRQSYRVVCYGLNLQIGRTKQGWQATLGNTTLALFNKRHDSGQTIITDIIYTGGAASSNRPQYRNALVKLLTQTF